MQLFALILLLAPPGWSGASDAAGQRTGEWIRRSTQGVKLAVARYADGRLHGLQEVFKADGSACWSGTFERGTGVLEEYTADCQLKSRVQHLDGRVHGLSEHFDRGGRLVNQARYQFGLPHGLQTRWTFPTKGPAKIIWRCMYAGRGIWRSVHGSPVDACAVETLAGTGIWRSPLYRRTRKGLTVEQVYSKGPGAAAGVVAGDVIVAIDGRRLPGPGPEETQQMLVGTPGSTVRITVRRGDGEIEIPIVRQPIDLKGWVEEMEAEARAKPKQPVELLNTPEPKFPGRGG